VTVALLHSEQLHGSLTVGSAIRRRYPHVRRRTRLCMDPWHYENEAWNAGRVTVAGVDEAGRGPLAGPVVAAAVVLARDFAPDGVADSKALTERARERVCERILREAAAVGVGIVGPEIIDEINILRATHRAMADALRSLRLPCDFALVDGLPVTGLSVESRAIVKGDALSVSIGAASIVAKVTRDRIMRALDQQYPAYGFADHKGYCTRAHLAAIDNHGPCPCHRRSFAPVAERLAQCRLPGLV